ncbi:hypothetical protein [Amycolatopsis sp. NPDC049868]|uniref:hypothetical protein n=1 Tax=Amycolatopsis sp. NPDC049868 TaxID=3363934 RepID=UPI0037967054
MVRETAESTTDLVLRKPDVPDAASMYELAYRSEWTEAEPLGTYVNFCRDFAATSLVAVEMTGLTGFLLGYVKPRDPSSYFVWQAAVRRGAAPGNVAYAMLADMVLRVRSDAVRYFEVAVGADDHVLAEIVHRLALDQAVELGVTELFSDGETGSGHGAKMLYRFAMREAAQARQGGRADRG